MEINVSQIAEISGFDRATVRKRLDGLSCRDAGTGGRYYDSKVAFRQLYLGGSGDEGVLDPTAEKAKLDKARRELAELDYAVKRRELLREESVFRALDAAAIAFKGRLEEIPGRFSSIFAAEGDPRTIESTLMREIHAALNHVIDARDKFTQKADSEASDDN